MTWLKTSAAVRSRGYVAGMGDEPYSELEQTISRENRGYSPPDVTFRAAGKNFRDLLGEQGDLNDDVEYDLRSMAAPILKDHGVMQIGL